MSLWYKDSTFAHLFASSQGRPAESPGMLALITVMQSAKGLSDWQAAEAVRARIDWKYALRLRLEDEGFHFSVLSTFRERVLAGGAEQRLLDDMLRQYRERKLLNGRGRQHTDATLVLAAVRKPNRRETVGETLREVPAVEILRQVWLQQYVVLKGTLTWRVAKRICHPTVSGLNRPPQQH